MIRGNLETNTFTSGATPSTVVHLHPEVAVNFSDNWMAGAELSIDFGNRMAEVGHGLFIRHTFIKAGKHEVFSYVFLNKKTSRPLVPGGGNNKTSVTKIGPGVGLLHFFNSAVALETKLDYNLYHNERYNSYNAVKLNGNFFLSAGLQYFFDSKLTSDSTKIDYQIYKGDWIIGGLASFGSQDILLFSSSYTANLLQPFAGYFITDHIVVGSGLNYNNDNYFGRFILGLSPFGRYYLKVRRKHQFFGELKFAYNMIWENVGDNKYDRRPFSYILSPGIGYSTRILPQVSFDIMLNMDRNTSYISGLETPFKSNQFNINVGLTAFLTN